jgi:hypothetical protein
MPRAENKSEVLVHHTVVNPTSAIVVRQIEDSRGRHYLDVRQCFKNDPADEDWIFTRYGVRLDHEAVTAIKGVTLPKNPVDTKTVTTRVDNSIKLPASAPKAAKK